MSESIDARGMMCPQPVVMTKKKLEKMDSGTLDVIVDNKPSSLNVARFVKNTGCLAEVEEKDGVFIIHVTKGATCAVTEESTEKEIVVFISSDTVGSGDELLICGTCLDFFGLKDKVKVGSISNMFELVTTLSRADRVMSM